MSNESRSSDDFTRDTLRDHLTHAFNLAEAADDDMIKYHLREAHQKLVVLEDNSDSEES